MFASIAYAAPYQVYTMKHRKRRLSDRTTLTCRESHFRTYHQKVVVTPGLTRLPVGRQGVSPFFGRTMRSSSFSCSRGFRNNEAAAVSF